MLGGGEEDDGPQARARRVAVQAMRALKTQRKENGIAPFLDGRAVVMAPPEWADIYYRRKKSAVRRVGGSGSGSGSGSGPGPVLQGLYEDEDEGTDDMLRAWDLPTALAGAGIARAGRVPDKQVWLGSATVLDEEADELVVVPVAVKVISLDVSPEAARVDARVLWLGTDAAMRGHTLHFPLLYSKLLVMHEGALCCALVMERFDQTLAQFLGACVDAGAWDAVHGAVLQALQALFQGRQLLDLVHNDMSLANFMVNVEDHVDETIKTPTGTVLRVVAPFRVVLLDFGRSTVRSVGGDGVHPHDDDPAPSLAKDAVAFARKLRASLPQEWFVAGGAPSEVAALVAMVKDADEVKTGALTPHQWLFDLRLTGRFLVKDPVPPSTKILGTLGPLSKS